MPPHFIEFEQGNTWLSEAISIYHCRFSVNAYADELFAEHRIFFPPTIQNAVAKRRAEFLAGRYCAQKSMKSLCNSAVDIHIGAHRNPQWPPHIVGSISHNKAHAVAVTAFKTDVRGVGVDIEDQVKVETYEQIKGQILFGEEYNVIRQVNNKGAELTFFTLAFSAKESFFKAAFPEVGKYFDFSCLSILDIDQHNQTLILRINETLSDKLIKGMQVTAYYRVLTEQTLATLVKLDPTENDKKR